MSQLVLNDVEVEYPTEQGVFRAVDGVSLVVKAGRTLALVGESGSGKSSLAKAIVGIERASAGEITYGGRPLGTLGSPGRRELCRQIQMIFQDPDASLNPRMSLGACLEEALLLSGTAERAQHRERAQLLLEQVGLDGAFEARFPHELSGGQKQRVCIARALAARPSLIVCDEVVSALDVSVQAQILNLLVGLQREHELALLFISHDLAVVRQIADDVAVMYKGKVVEQGRTADVIDHPQNAYTRTLIDAVPSIAGRTIGAG